MSVWSAIRDALAWKPPRAAAGDWDGWPTGEGPFDFEDDDGVGFHVSEGLAGIISTGDTSEARAYRDDPAIRICVDFLATNVAHTKLKTYDRRGPNDRPEAPESRTARVLRRPNPRMSGFDLILSLVGDLALYDDAYWLTAFSTEREDRLYRIPPTLIEPKGGDVLRGPANYEIRRPDGRPVQTVTPDRIIHFHWYNPLDTRRGMTRLRALRAILDEERQASRHRYWYWRNAGRYQDVLERPADAAPWTDERRRRFREDWASRYTGGRNAGVPAVAEDGMKYVTAGFSPRDSEFIAGREWALDIAATTYAIPLAMLSRNDSQAFASMREFHKILYTDVLGPWDALIENTIDTQMVPLLDGGNIYVEFNIDEKMQGDFEEQANAARSAVQVPFLSVDDMRAKRGEPPLGPPYDKPARPSNYIFDGADTVEPTEEPTEEPENVVRMSQEGA